MTSYDVDPECDNIEYTILGKRDVNAFQVPPRSTAAGYKAEDWKDKCFFSGKITVVAKGNHATVRLLQTGTSELFLQTVIENGDHEKFVERTVDSSRYFVLRAVHPQTKAAVYVGLGFEDRNDAFDFNCALTDFKNRNELTPEQESIVKIEPKDYSLKEGQKITINLGNKKKVDKPVDETTTSQFKKAGLLLPPSEGGFILPPPPSGPSSSTKSELMDGRNANNAKDTSKDTNSTANSKDTGSPMSSQESSTKDTSKETKDTSKETRDTAKQPSSPTFLKNNNPFGDGNSTSRKKKSNNPFQGDPFAKTNPFEGDDDFFGDFQSGT